MPIQSAIDYYEQLDPLLPTQYELLLKQLMRMQPPPVELSTPSSEPIGWKQVWDCFYDMAETKLISDMETAVAANGLTPENQRFEKLNYINNNSKDILYVYLFDLIKQNKLKI